MLPKTDGSALPDDPENLLKCDFQKDMPSESEQRLEDARAEKKAVRRFDWIVLPAITLFALLAYLDRSNLGNARVAGLQHDLKMTDHQFSIALTLTFVPYIAAEIPVNLLLKRIGANVLIPLLVTIWGFITTFQGFVKSYKGLLVTRFLLGAVEGGLYPASVLYISSYYRRSEIQIRIALFAATASLSGAVAGILAYGLIHLDGIGGKPGWAWIFIVEGAFTIVCGFIGFFVFPQSPSTSRFMPPEQRTIMTNRIQKDKPNEHKLDQDNFSWYQVFCALKSPHVFLLVAALFMTGCNLYGLAYFQPSIVHSLGYSGQMTQLISAPPFLVAFAFTMATSYASDRYRARGATAIISASIGLVGYAIFFTHSSPHVRYASIFLSTSGIYSVSPTMYAWLANNSSPHFRQATAIAMGAMSGNTGGILSTWLFPKSAEPSYRTATIVNMSFSAGIIVLCSINLMWLRHCNLKKEAEQRQALSRTQNKQTESNSQEHFRIKEENGPKGNLEPHPEVYSGNTQQLLGDKYSEFIYAY